MNRSFRNGERVIVSHGDDKGKTGVVVRLRRADRGAWIYLDSEPLHPHFPVGDDRHRHVMLYPEDVDATKQSI
jgi:hypothetical protein